VSRPSRAGEAGFTLIELLVALVLVAFLTTLVFGGLRLAVRAWAKTHEGVAEAADLWAVENVLRQAIVEAKPIFASAHTDDRTIVFDGNGESLALLAPLPQAVAAGITARMRFFLLPDGTSNSLFMAWRVDLPAAESGMMLSEDRVKLLDRVRAIHFDYLGPVQASGPAVWQSTWSERTRLPDLVRIRLERDGAAMPEWPELLAEPKGTMTTGCLYDPVSGDCRRIQ
jgi:general secretion pathway protein J